MGQIDRGLYIIYIVKLSRKQNKEWKTVPFHNVVPEGKVLSTIQAVPEGKVLSTIQAWLTNRCDLCQWLKAAKYGLPRAIDGASGAQTNDVVSRESAEALHLAHCTCLRAVTS